MKLPVPPPSSDELFARLLRVDQLVQIVAASRPVDSKNRYLHWDDLRHKTPPAGLTSDQWWMGTKLSRASLARQLPLRAVDGRQFTFCNVDAVQELVHHIDQKAGGHIMTDDPVMNVRSSDRYLVSSLQEEAITSSQLEGASTTRLVAKQLLATGRPPSDKSEQMIVNNFHAMLAAQEMASHDLTADDVLELHRIVSQETLDDPADAGRLQTPSDERVLILWDTGKPQEVVLHRPPPAAELASRLDAMCRFANGEDTGGFVHPVVRAILLHFWLAYDHPFVDGNGRTARALFYWSMLRDGYWLTQYLSISSILRTAPSKYARSYLLSESDDNDATYFVIYQLQVIERAIQALHEYLARKMAETRQIEALLRGSHRLNNRQLQIVSDALRDPGEPFTVAAQARRNRVTLQSARTDLLGLESLGLFEREQIGKKFVFRALPDLVKRLGKLK